jgi:transposase InsO family protein
VNTDAEASALSELDEPARARAWRRWALLAPVVNDGVPLARAAAAGDVPLRTAQRWLSRYQAGGLVGLARAPRTDRGVRRTRSELVELIEGLALSTPAPSVATITRRVAKLAHAHGWPAPAYSTVHEIGCAVDPQLMTLAHDGPEVFRDRYELALRRHAERPNQIWQADHTELDILVLDADGSPTRPWLTVVLDDCSRAVPGYTVFLGAPSALNLSLAMRQAIWHKTDPNWVVHGIPEVLYADHGSDFTSDHLAQVCVDLHVRLVHSGGAIDAAEAERDTALAHAREAERVAALALEQRRSAEDAAEHALGEVETAQEARDQARLTAEQAGEAAGRAQAELAVATEEWTRTTARLEAVSTELQQAREQLSEVRGQLGQARDTIAATRQEATDLAAARDALTDEVAAERGRTAEQHRRAEDAERETSRAQGSVEQLRGELAAAREAGDRHQGEVLRVGTELATATAQLAAARDQVAAEKAHAAERIADQRQRTEAAEREGQQLRADLDQQRTRHSGEIEDLRRQLADLKPRAEGRDKAR